MDAADGFRMHRKFLSETEVHHWRRLIESRRDLFLQVAAKARMNLPYSVVDGNQVEAELPELFALVQGKLRLALEEAVGQPLELTNAPKIVAIRDHIQQVFMNILLNAIHASPKGGEVRARIFPEDVWVEGGRLVR